MQPRRELPGIHLLRAAASLVIAAYHANVSGVASDHAPWLVTLAGPVAVAPSLTSLFLTLSGFALYYADATRPSGRTRTAREFWAMRAARLVPLMLLGHMLVAPFELGGTFRYTGGEAVVRSVLVATATQSWYPPYALSFDSPTWTLSVLAFAYLTYPWLARRAATVTAHSAAMLLVALWIGSMAVSRAILEIGGGAQDVTSPPHTFVHVFPAIRALEFASGVLLGRLWVAVHGRFSTTWVVTALVPALVLVVAIATGILLPRPAAILGYGGLMPLWWVLIWVISAVSISPAHAGWSQSLGRASFAIYVLHFPLLMIVQAMLFRGWLGAHAGIAITLWYFSLIPIGLVAERWFVAPVARRLTRGRGAVVERPVRAPEGMVMTPPARSAYARRDSGERGRASRR